MPLEAAATPDLTPFMEEARALHARTLVIDGHADTLNRMLDEGMPFTEPSPYHIDLPRLKEAGVNAQVFSLWIPDPHLGDRALPRALQMIGACLDLQRDAPELRQILAVADLDPARPGFIFSFEGADPLLSDLGLLPVFYRLGLRMIGFTWNGRNAFADGQRVGPRPSGLTALGRDLLDRMGELGIVPDVAHLAEPGFWDVMERATGPVVATHANVHALHPHLRNLSDDQIKAIARSGGLVGITFVPSFLAKEAADLDDVIAHLEYVIDLVGDDYVGLGSDFDGITAGPTRLGDVGALPNLTAGLLARGHASERIAKILGGNWARVFRAVWK